MGEETETIPHLVVKHECDGDCDNDIERDDAGDEVRKLFCVSNSFQDCVVEGEGGIKKAPHKN